MSNENRAGSFLGGFRDSALFTAVGAVGGAIVGTLIEEFWLSAIGVALIGHAFSYVLHVLSSNSVESITEEADMPDVKHDLRNSLMGHLGVSVALLFISAVAGAYLGIGQPDVPGLPYATP